MKAGHDATLVTNALVMAVRRRGKEDAPFAIRTGDHGFRAPFQRLLEGSTSAYHLYTVRVENRDDVLAALRAQDIGCGVYYPHPLHQQSCFAHYDPQPCPEADALAASVLSLPCFPGLTVEEQARVIDAVRTLVGA